MLYQLNVRELTYALSIALDYVGIDNIKHGKRVAYIACEIAKKLGWRTSKCDKVIQSALLHDCGIASTSMYHNIIHHFDWEDVHNHCAQGAKLIKSVPLFHDLTDIIAFHHTQWEQFLPQIDEETKLFANLIYLSDRIDVLYEEYGAEFLAQKELIRCIIQKNTPAMFSPKLSEAFIELSHTDNFWYGLESDPLHYYFSQWVEKGVIEMVSFSLLKSVASMFAKIVDAKQGHTFSKHPSLYVASLTQTLAQLCNLSLREQEEIELATLLRHLGCLRIPDSLRERKTLSDEEAFKMKRQGFDTLMIIQQIKGFEPIAKILSLYHQYMADEGFTCKSCEQKLPVEVAIIVLAHSLQTLFGKHKTDPLDQTEIETTIQQTLNASQIEEPVRAKIISFLHTLYKKESALSSYM